MDQAGPERPLPSDGTSSVGVVGLLRSFGAGRSTTYVGTERLAAGIAVVADLTASETNAPLEAQRGSIVAALAERLKGRGLVTV